MINRAELPVSKKAETIHDEQSSDKYIIIVITYSLRRTVVLNTCTFRYIPDTIPAR